MSDFTIVLGNKRYSSWSLRGWLPLKQTGAAFEEVVIPLDRPETKREILRHSPAGKVPILKTKTTAIWDSLAIVEFLHETFPKAGLWPRDPAARAHARAVVMEMHSGFATLRRRLPMDVCGSEPRRGEAVAKEPDLAADVARIVAIWTDCRARYRSGGDFLFGGWTAADAFFAPVATRFVTYGVPLAGAAAAYRDAAMAWPALREWIAAAQAETWVVTYD